MNDNIQQPNYDARIVQTVRNLKKTPSRHSDEAKSGSDDSNTRGITSSGKSKEDMYILI